MGGNKHQPSMHFSYYLVGLQIPDRLRYAIEVRLPGSKLTKHSEARHIWTCTEEVDLECCEHYFHDWYDASQLPLKSEDNIPLKDYTTKHGLYKNVIRALTDKLQVSPPKLNSQALSDLENKCDSRDKHHHERLNGSNSKPYHNVIRALKKVG
jgi:hypothetical protein